MRQQSVTAQLTTHDSVILMRAHFYRRILSGVGLV